MRIKKLSLITVVLLLVFFISGCYTVIHPPFTVEERVIVKKEKLERYKEEEQSTDEEMEYNDEGEVVEYETHIYHHYYPDYDWFPHRYHYYHHFYPEFGFHSEFIPGI